MRHIEGVFSFGCSVLLVGYWIDFGTYARHLQHQRAVTDISALLGSLIAQMSHMIWWVGCHSYASL